MPSRGLDRACVAICIGAAAWLSLAGAARAGGSGLSTVVVVNTASSNSLALGNYYAERRQIPPRQVLRIAWTGAPTSWSLAEYEQILAAPLRTLLTGLGPASQVDTVALSMDIPYRVVGAAENNSTTSVLFYGFKTNNPPPRPQCVLFTSSTNRYAFSEDVFRQTAHGTNRECFLAAMLTAGSVEAACRLVDQGVGSDGTFPAQPVRLAKTTDPARNVRHLRFDNVLLDLAVDGRRTAYRTNSDQTSGLAPLAGFQTGLATLTVSAGTFDPGAVADSLTSYGGLLFEPSGQTSLLEFIHAGAAGSYGTVEEPCNYLEKFPDPLVYFYQARGFTLAEAYYQSLQSPAQGLIVGEPLAAPYARRAAGAWLSPTTNQALSGMAPLALEFQAASPAHPLERLDLYVDGCWHQTLAHLGPTQGNVLRVVLNGVVVDWPVPAQASLRSLATELAQALNALSVSNRTRVWAIPTGDRIELQSTDPVWAGADLTLSAASEAGAASACTVFLAAGQSRFVDSPARGSRSGTVQGVSQSGDWLQLAVTKTNGVEVLVAVTNSAVLLTTAELTFQLAQAVNGSPLLQGVDGLAIEDVFAESSQSISFRLVARAPGPMAAAIQARLSASPALSVSPATSSALDENLTDLRPRNHLTLTCGAASLAVSGLLDTSSLADGWHELEAVAFEGSHVRTQTRLSRWVQAQNSSLTATLASSAPLGAASLGDVLRFTASAGPGPVASIELFSTGGAWGTVTNTSAAEFAIPASNLGAGLHPFWVLATAADGQRYQTRPQRIRLSAAPLATAFPVSIRSQPIALAWPAVAGHVYDVLRAATVSGPFAVRASVPASQTEWLEWIDPSPDALQGFYRVVAR